MTDRSRSVTEELCTGCGALVPRIDGPVHRYMTAAPRCWAMYGELLAYCMERPTLRDAHQLCVDAYAAQHPGGADPQAVQSVAVHLMSLYAQLELGASAQAVAGVLQRGAERKGAYQRLAAPSFQNVPTVGHVLAHRDRIDALAREWATGVWDAWRPHHAEVRQWYERVVGR